MTLLRGGRLFFESGGLENGGEEGLETKVW